MGQGGKQERKDRRRDAVPKKSLGAPVLVLVGRGKDAGALVNHLEQAGWSVRHISSKTRALKPGSLGDADIMLLLQEGSPRSALRFFQALGKSSPGLGKVLLSVPPSPKDLRTIINQGGIDHLIEPPFTPDRVLNAVEQAAEALEAKRAVLALPPGARVQWGRLKESYALMEARVMERTTQLTKANRQLRKALREIEEKNKSLTALNQTLKIQSTTDHLTGLYNRREFLSRIRFEWGRYRRYGRAISLIMLDIDHFKKINDTHGHECGDMVLRELGALIMRHRRAQDLCCRYGGEEFIVLLTETSLETAFHVAEGLRLLVMEHAYRYKKKKIAVRISLGVSGASEQDPKDVDAFINLADTAMYEAKRHGRNKTVVIDPKRPRAIIRQSPGRGSRGGAKASRAD